MFGWLWSLSLWRYFLCNEKLMSLKTIIDPLERKSICLPTILFAIISTFTRLKLVLGLLLWISILVPLLNSIFGTTAFGWNCWLLSIRTVGAVILKSLCSTTLFCLFFFSIVPVYWHQWLLDVSFWTRILCSFFSIRVKSCHPKFVNTSTQCRSFVDVFL